MLEDHLNHEVATADDLFESIVTLATASSAIDLRLGRLLAWFKVQDLKPLGYSSFVAFRRERVDVNDTRQKQLTRLATSGSARRFPCQRDHRPSPNSRTEREKVQLATGPRAGGALC
ncbi:MAG: hypothetical protein QF464_08130, partial [Myxococcota bacterium]|nr:hypothetical protein [Myxococcota bacterium]